MSETYKAIEVRKPGEFAEVRRPLQDPVHDQVRIRVEACGVCHSDAATVEGSFPGIAYLKEHAGAFDPDEIRILVAAFDKTWESVQASGAIVDTDTSVESARAILAKHIIEAAGVNDT